MPCILSRRPRSLDVHVAPQPSGLIIVEAYERQKMRLCSPDELPAWARNEAIR
jgi:hypothetical protein